MNPGLSGARTTGADHASGTVIAFLDDDAVAAPGWLEALIAAYRDPEVLGAGGPVEPNWRAPRPPWFPDEFHWASAAPMPAWMCVTAVSATRSPPTCLVRADVLRRAGGSRPISAAASSASPSAAGLRIIGKAESCARNRVRIRAAALHPGRYFVTRKEHAHHAVPAQRTTWKYFVHRCLVEGAAKAALTALAGSSGLGTEGRYVREVLPRAVARNLKAALRGEAGAASRAAGIIAGLGLTASSCVMTRFANAWVLATEKPRGEGSAQMDDTLSRGIASAGTAPPRFQQKELSNDGFRHGRRRVHRWPYGSRSSRSRRNAGRAGRSVDRNAGGRSA